jgi:DNA polymerase epsilon subunit 4
VPKTQPYSKIKEQAAATRARLNGDAADDAAPSSGGKKQKLIVKGGIMRTAGADDRSEDPNAQLELETQQAAGDQDVEMTG